MNDGDLPSGGLSSDVVSVWKKDRGAGGREGVERVWGYGMGASLSAEAVIVAQDTLVLLVRAELDGGIGHHAHHGGRVPAPQTEEALVEVGEVEQPKGLLGGWRGKVNASTYLLSTFPPLPLAPPAHFVQQGDQAGKAGSELHAEGVLLVFV